MDARILKVLDIIRESSGKKPTIAQLKHVVGLSSSRLEHLFKDVLHQSITSFVQEERLAAAAELLLTTNLCIKEIYCRLGFGDRSNFNHWFKQRFGVSPKKYRTQAKSRRQSIAQRQLNRDWSATISIPRVRLASREGTR